MREQVEIFFNLQKAQDTFQDYFQFESWDSPQCYVLYRDLPFDNPNLMAVNTSFSCRYMTRGVSWLWDMSNLYPYPSDANAVDAVRWETKIFCNVLVRFWHIDFHELFEGSDTRAIRFLIDRDSKGDNTAAFVSFLNDQRAPVERNTIQIKYTIVNPNCCLDDKF